MVPQNNKPREDGAQPTALGGALSTKKQPPAQSGQPVATPIQYNSREEIKVGEISIASEILRADALASIILSLLKDKNVQKYLNVVERKKSLRGVG